MKLRLSYSLLTQWAKGDVDGAVNTYFHMTREPNKYMEAGTKIHKQIQDHIVEHKQFPDWFFRYEFKSPENEKELIVPYNELFDLKVVLDTYDSGVGFEYKTGVSDSLKWSRTAQIPIYMLACKLAGLPLEKIYLMRWNQYIKERDFVLLWASNSMENYAREYIDSYAPEIYAFFESEGLI